MPSNNVPTPRATLHGLLRVVWASGCAIPLALPCAARTQSAAPTAEKAASATAPAARNLGARLEFPLVGDGKPTGLAAADLDGDGAQELVALTIAPPALQIWSRMPRVARQWPEPRAYPIDDFALGPVWLGGVEPAHGSPARLVFSSRTKPGVTVVDAGATWKNAPGEPLVVAWHVDLERRARVLASGDLGADGAPEIVLITIDDELVIVRSATDVRRHPLDESQATCAVVARDGKALYVGFQASRRLVRYSFSSDGTLKADARVDLPGLPRALAEVDLGPRGTRTLLVAGGESQVSAFSVDERGFTPTTTFDGGTIPIALMAGDVRAPLESPHERATWISIALRGLEAVVHDARGDEAKARRWYAGQHPVAGTLGDFDGDGATDLAIANSDARRVSVAFGDGRGGFVNARTSPSGRGVHSLAAGDVDGDGRTDVVALGALDGTLNVHLGVEGRLASGVGSGYMRSGNALTLHDLDGDGALDAVCVRGTDLGAVIDVAFGNGRGLFARRADVPTRAVGVSPGDLWIGDLDGDGSAEIVTTDPEGARVHVTDVVRAAGPGVKFGEPREIALGGGPFALAPVDAEGDARPEFAVALSGAADRRGVALLRVVKDAAARPTLQEFRRLAGEDSARALAVADFDGNGRVDVAVLESKSDSESRVRVHLQGTDRAFVSSSTTLATGLRAYALRAGDVDGDGAVDLLASAQNSHHVNVWLNGGARADHTVYFARAADLGAGTGPLDLLLVDLDGDGGLELVVADSFANDVATIRLR